jgi:Domain of unknown function (DUF892)
LAASLACLAAFSDAILARSYCQGLGRRPIFRCPQRFERLEQVFELLGEPARGKNCPAIMGIIEEGQEIMKEYKGTPALDAGLLSAAQSVEHYEISRYGTLKTWAGESWALIRPSAFSTQPWPRKRLLMRL